MSYAEKLDELIKRVGNTVTLTINPHLRKRMSVKRYFTEIGVPLINTCERLSSRTNEAVEKDSLVVCEIVHKGMLELRCWAATAELAMDDMLDLLNKMDKSVVGDAR